MIEWNSGIQKLSKEVKNLIYSDFVTQNQNKRTQKLLPPPPQLNKMISEVLVVRLQGTRLMMLHV